MFSSKIICYINVLLCGILVIFYTKYLPVELNNYIIHCILLIILNSLLQYVNTHSTLLTYEFLPNCIFKIYSVDGSPNWAMYIDRNEKIFKLTHCICFV
jgi:hypothetical protein